MSKSKRDELLDDVMCALLGLVNEEQAASLQWDRTPLAMLELMFREYKQAHTMLMSKSQYANTSIAGELAKRRVRVCDALLEVLHATSLRYVQLSEHGNGTKQTDKAE